MPSKIAARTAARDCRRVGTSVPGWPLAEGRSLEPDQAVAWIETNVPEGTPVYVDFGQFRTLLPTPEAADRLWADVAAPWLPGEPNEKIVAWGGEASGPIVAWAKEKPINRWIDILYLTERLAPKPPLIPAEAAQRVLMIGLLRVVALDTPSQMCSARWLRQNVAAFGV